MRNAYYLMLILGLGLFSSCDWYTIFGNGVITVNSYNLPSFDQLKVSGAFAVEVVQGDESKVTIEADENLMDYIEAEVHFDRLNIKLVKRSSLSFTKTPRIIVETPALKSIKLSGASSIKSRSLKDASMIDITTSGAGKIYMNLDAPRVKVSVSGAGDAELQGLSRDLEISISGAGKVDAFDLKSETAKIKVSGAGKANVYASKNIEATTSGAGKISYKGPARVDSRISGAGSIKYVTD